MKNADNTTDFEELRRKRKKKRRLKRLLIFFCVLALGTAGLFSASYIYHLDLRTQVSNLIASLKTGGGFPVSTDDVEVKGLLPMQRDVALLTTSGVYLYNSNGALLNSCLNGYANPHSRSSAGKLLTYDLGGDGLRVDNKSKNLFETRTDGSIYAADICASGAIAVAQSATGYLAEVTAYTSRFEEMYSWLTSECYITDLALAPKGTMLCASGIRVENGQMISQLRFHHFDRDEEVAKVELQNQVVLSMVWTREETLQVLTDQKAFLYSKNGVMLMETDLPGELKMFENVESGGFYIACGDHRSSTGTVLEAYNEKLQKVGSATIDRELLSLGYSEGRLLILAEGRLYLADKYLGEVQERSSEDLYYVCAVGNIIYGIGADGLVRQNL